MWVSSGCFQFPPTARILTSLNCQLFSKWCLKFYFWKLYILTYGHECHSNTQYTSSYLLNCSLSMAEWLHSTYHRQVKTKSFGSLQQFSGIILFGYLTNLSCFTLNVSLLYLFHNLLWCVLEVIVLLKHTIVSKFQTSSWILLYWYWYWIWILIEDMLKNSEVHNNFALHQFHWQKISHRAWCYHQHA